jgi:hypothetical protein
MRLHRAFGVAGCARRVGPRCVPSHSSTVVMARRDSFTVLERVVNSATPASLSSSSIRFSMMWTPGSTNRKEVPGQGHAQLGVSLAGPVPGHVVGAAASTPAPASPRETAAAIPPPFR